MYAKVTANCGPLLMLAALAIPATFLVTVTSCLAKKGKKVLANPQKTAFQTPRDRVRKLVLANGMTILAYQDSSVPQVLVQIAYDIGSAVEQSDERGLAHLIEHMIFKGTRQLSEGDIDAIARKFGAVFNAFTSNDVTSYYYQSNSSNWKPFVNVLFDCMKNARFDEQHLASELRAVVQELNMYRDRPVSCMFEKAFKLAFPSNHPYHFPVIGFKEGLANLNAADLKVFYDKYYHPERATLFLVGDLDLERDVDFAASIFSALPLTKSASRPLFPPVIQETAVTKSTMYHDVQMPMGCMYWTVPGLKQNGCETANILCPILGSGDGSRLHQTLVDDLQIADDISCNACVLEHAGLMAIFFTPKPDKMEECYQTISDELHKIVLQGVNADELQRAVAGGVTTFLSSLEDASQMVSYWIESFFVRRDEFELFSYPEKIEALTVTDIANYVKENLNPFLAGRIDLLPLPETAKPLWLDANSKIREQELDILRRHQRTTEVEAPRFVNSLDEPVAVAFKFPQPTDQFTLDCGLQVLVRVDKKIPIVCGQFVLKEGEYLSHAKEGVAVNIMRSMLPEGSIGFSKKENIAILDSLGALSLASGSFVVTAANFAQTMEHFFRIMTQPEFKQAALNKIKEITLNDIERDKDSPNNRAVKALWQDLFAGTEYAWSFEEASELVRAVTLADLKAKHREFISPDRMILALVGDVDAQAVKTLLQKLTAGWQISKDKTVRVIPKPKLETDLELKIPMFRDQAVLLFGRGSKLDFFHPDSLGMDLLSKIVFESLGSRVFQLRERSGLFYTSSGCFASGRGLGKGIDFVRVLLNPENVDRTAALLGEVLAEVHQNGVTQEELDSAKQMALQSLISFASSSSALASTMAGLAILGAGFDYYEKAWNKVQAFDLTQINELARKYCSLKGMAKIQAGGS